jgi:hypothetical protein
VIRLSTLAAVLALVTTASAHGAETCRTVQGRMMLSNGAPSVRIWVAHAKRTLGVVQQDETFGELPAPIRHAWSAKGVDSMWANDLLGDFHVCAEAPSRPGRMQLVRVVEGHELKIAPRR